MESRFKTLGFIVTAVFLGSVLCLYQLHTTPSPVECNRSTYEHDEDQSNCSFLIADGTRPSLERTTASYGPQMEKINYLKSPYPLYLLCVILVLLPAALAILKKCILPGRARRAPRERLQNILQLPAFLKVA